MSTLSIIIISGYLLISIPIFLKVNKTSQIVIDEEFHIPQAKNFCIGNFDVWDPKITTFPGLYIISVMILPIKFCTTFYLRSISLLTSVINVYLIYKIIKLKYTGNIIRTLNTINIAIIPPMYFFTHLYYTDVISITTVLCLYYNWLRNHHQIAAICGALAVLMRQTNIIWVVMFFGSSAINEMFLQFKSHQEDNQSQKHKLSLMSEWNFFYECMLFYLRNFKELFDLFSNVINLFWGYITVICAFLIFVIVNGSIVVGDKSAHEASLHLPQLFYYSIFVEFFGFAVTLPSIIPVLRSICNHKKLMFLPLITVISIIWCNTIEHPYLLADNRHYTFYIWTRLYSKYSYFKYLMAPVYIFCIFLICYNLNNNQKFSLKLMYAVSTITVLTLQRMIEVRYFILPYLILRLLIKTNNKKLLFIELLQHILINIITFYIFFTKEIKWDNFTEIQRLIW